MFGLLTQGTFFAWAGDHFEVWVNGFVTNGPSIVYYELFSLGIILYCYIKFFSLEKI